MRSQSLYLVLSVITASMMIVGCEESVDPVLESEEAFSFFGFFNPRADTQSVRVFPIEGILEPTDLGPIDAQVKARDLQTGMEYSWQDSVVIFRNQTIGHVFWSAFQPQHEHTYRLQAERSDGAVTSVDVRVPPVGTVRIGDIRDVSFNVQIPVIWSKIPRILNPLAVYNVRTVSRATGQEFEFRIGVVPPDPVQRDDGSWAVNIEASRDIGELFSVLDLRPGLDILKLDNIDLKVFVVDETWNPPGGVFDSEVLVEPGTFSNVDSGFGFVGGGYIDSYRVELSDDVKNAIGFSVQ